MTGRAGAGLGSLLRRARRRCALRLRGASSTTALGQESGQVLVLTAAFVAFALALTVVVVSATAVHLDRKRLADLADATALAAADSVAADELYEGGQERPSDAGGLVLSDDGVREAAGEFLATAVGPSGLEGVTLLEASSPDGRSAHVELVVTSRPVLVSWVVAAWSDGVAVRASATARAW